MKQIYTLLLILLVLPLGAQNKNIDIHLKINNVKDCNLVLKRFEKHIQIADTFSITNGRSHISLPLSDTIISSIGILSNENSFDNPRGSRVYPSFSLICVPGEKQELEVTIFLKKPSLVKLIFGEGISLDFSRLYYDILQPLEYNYKQLIIDNIIASGDINQYQKEYSTNALKTREAIVKFNTSNPQSYITLHNFSTFYNQYDENYMEDTFNKMNDNYKRSSIGKYVKNRLDNGKKYRIGSTAANFTRTSLDGDTISLYNFKGKYVVLDFWGSWCSPCRASHPQLIKLYNKYSKMGLVMIGVAQENGRDIEIIRNNWEKAVIEDQLPWIQILENEDPVNNINRKYNIFTLPTKIVISPEGKIIAKFSGNSDLLEGFLEKQFETNTD